MVTWKDGLVVFVLLVAFLFPLFFNAGIPKAKADSKLNIAESQLANGVFEIYVTNHSRYIVDRRFDLCFYETTIGSWQGVSVVQIRCDGKIFEAIVK